MPYVDGFVLPVPVKTLPAYRRMAAKVCKIWMDHGALEYRECIGDDLNTPVGIPFPKLVTPKRGETIVFAWIYYKNKAHRDRVNKKVMADPRIAQMCNEKKMPFDCARMSWGGFKVIVKS